MPDDDQARMAEKTKRQKEQLQKANPGAKVDVDNRKDGDVEVNTVKVSTERTG